MQAQGTIGGDEDHGNQYVGKQCLNYTYKVTGMYMHTYAVIYSIAFPQVSL